MKQGIKNDFKDNKLRWDLLPLEELEDIVKVYTEGSKKYGVNTWQLLKDGYSRYKAALFRHLVLFEKGEEMDNETGCRHLAQVAWNAIAMLYCSKHGETQESLIDKLNNRISKKIDDCNSLLDILDIDSMISEKEHKNRENIEECQKKEESEIREKLDNLGHELSNRTYNRYNIKAEYICRNNDGNHDVYYDISSLGDIQKDIFGINIDKDVIPCVHFTGSTDFHTLNILVNNLIRRYEDEHNKGKSGTGNGNLSKNDREVSNGSRICKS